MMINKLKPLLESPLVQLLARFILGGIFIYASFHKIFNPVQFAQIIENYQLFPQFSIHLIAIILPWIELIAGLFLVTGHMEKGSAMILSSLLVMFIIAIGINIIRGLDFDCGCFTSSGKGDAPISLLIRDFFILIPGTVILLFSRESNQESE